MRHSSVALGIWLLVVGSPAFAQSLRASSSGPNRIVVFADGNLRAALGQDDAAQSAAGSLGVGYRSGHLGAQFVINAVGQATPIRENFGSSILAPGSGTSLSAGLLEVTYELSDRGTIPICGTFIGRGYASVSSAEWVDTATTNTQEEQRYGVVSGGGGIGLRCEFFGGQVVNPPRTNTVEVANHPARTDSVEVVDPLDSVEGANEVAVYLDLGLALRTIGGDIASTANDALRTRLLGSDKSLRAGLELGLGIQVNGLKAGLTFYGFGGEVPGLSDGQVIAGFAVQTPIFQGVLAAPAQ